MNNWNVGRDIAHYLVEKPFCCVMTISKAELMTTCILFNYIFCKPWIVMQKLFIFRIYTIRLPVDLSQMFSFSVLLTVLWQSGTSGSDVISQDLYEEIFNTYKSQLLPVCAEGPTFVNVTLNIALRQIINLVRLILLIDDW